MQESKIDTKIETSRVSLLSQVYIWSVVMQPLYYFVLTPQNITGIGVSFSRILQFYVVASLCLKLLVPNRVRISNPFSPLNINYTYYFLFAVLAGCYGLISGAYSLDIGVTPIVDDLSFIASIIHNRFFRPFLEYFIIIYYFVYFVVLARYLISSEKAINYFFRLFFIVLLICLFVGYLDLFLQLLYKGEGRGSFSRQIYTYTEIGSLRFHGLAGEPREAFNYLMLSLGILALRDIWEDNKKLTLFWIIFIAITATLTQSFSGLIGIAFFCFLLFIFYFLNASSKVKLLSIFFVSLAFITIYINVTMSPRLMLYYTDSLSLYSQLDAGTEIGTVYKFVMNNVYPIWHLWLKIKEFEFLPFIIGNGLGSVRVINNYYMGTSELINPNAFIVKSLYETGVIGTLLFIAAFLAPIKKMYINNNINSKLIFLMLLMLGMYFAHKSAIPFIFLGIVLVILKNKSITSGSSS